MDIVAAGFLAALWAIGIWVPGTRNMRFIAFMGLLTAAFVAFGFLPSDISRLARAVVVVVWSGALLMPDRLGLGSLSHDETVFDEALVRVRDRISTPVLPTRVELEAATLEIMRLVPPSPEWASVKAAMLGDIRSRIELSDRPTTADDFTRAAAARSEWQRLRYRNVLGPHPES